LTFGWHVSIQRLNYTYHCLFLHLQASSTLINEVKNDLNKKKWFNHPQ
jgi:hypothetical protein